MDDLDEVKVVYEEEYRKQMALPVYFIATTPEHSNMGAGDRYYVVVEDSKSGKDHYIHEALCVGSARLGSVKNVPPTLLAFITEEKGKASAEDSLAKYEESSGVLKLAVMLNMQGAQDFVVEGFKSLEPIDDIREAVASIDYKADTDETATQAKRNIQE